LLTSDLHAAAGAVLVAAGPGGVAGVAQEFAAGARRAAHLAVKGIRRRRRCLRVGLAHQVIAPM
jgi:hypothetical protein